MNIDLGNLYRQRHAVSRSVSAENPTGEKGGGGKATLETSLTPQMSAAARELGQGWKVSPCARVASGETLTLMDVAGPGVVRHFWIAGPPESYREYILRIYWDGQDHPSVETPLSDFFCQGWLKPQDIFAGPINVNPRSALNCFFPMPFKKHVRVTLENRSRQDTDQIYYTFNYTLEDVPDEALYFHAQFRRTNPLPYGEDYVMLDGVRGQGHYVGAFMAWQQNSKGWWGEGEIKMYLDGDTDYPTICGTGTEDYFGGAWGFGGRNYSAACFGYQNTAGPAAYTAEEVAGRNEAGSRLTMYRFHTHDPVFFQQDLRVTMQALGWRSDARYFPLQDDISSVVYWYQTLPATKFPPLPSPDSLEIV